MHTQQAGDARCLGGPRVEPRHDAMHARAMTEQRGAQIRERNVTGAHSLWRAAAARERMCS